MRINYYMSDNDIGNNKKINCNVPTYLIKHQDIKTYDGVKA
jgi:hypothetical protein